MIDITMQPHCDECENCYWYWENQYDEYMNCGGEDKTCNEFIDIRESEEE